MQRNTTILPISPLHNTDKPSTSFISPLTDPDREGTKPRAALLDLTKQKSKQSKDV